MSDEGSVASAQSPLGSLLVVDDDPAVHELFQGLFEEPGYLLQPVGTVAQARAALQGVEFDLVVVDGQLPDGDGISLIREIRAHDAQQTLVFFSAHYRDPASHALLEDELGVALVMHKPVDPAELRMQIRELLRRARGRRYTPAPSATPLAERLHAMRDRYAARVSHLLGRIIERLHGARGGAGELET